MNAETQAWWHWVGSAPLTEQPVVDCVQQSVRSALDRATQWTPWAAARLRAAAADRARSKSWVGRVPAVIVGLAARTRTPPSEPRTA
eukprot:SAG22_NODE_1760_length_3634_cov_1.814144_5_plen_87_part_00